MDWDGTWSYSAPLSSGISFLTHRSIIPQQGSPPSCSCSHRLSIAIMPSKSVEMEVDHKWASCLEVFTKCITYGLIPLTVIFIEQGFLEHEMVPERAVQSYRGPSWGPGNCGNPHPRKEPSGASPLSTCMVEDQYSATRRVAANIFYASHVLEWLEVKTCDETDVVGCSSDRIWRKVTLREATGSSDPGCLQRSHFVAGIENFTVAFEHVAASEKEKSLLNVRQMYGSLLNQDGEEIKGFSQGRRDQMTLKALLEAAGTSNIDDPSDLVRNLDACEVWQKSQPDACCEDFGDSIRARGVELSVAIEYTNRIQGIELPTVFGWPLGTFRWYPLPVTPSYSIRVVKIPKQEAYFFGPPKDGTGGFALPAMNSEMLGHQYRVNTLSSGHCRGGNRYVEGGGTPYFRLFNVI